MKPIAAASTPNGAPLKAAPDDAWRERAGRLFAEFERPAKAMVRRAFKGAFCADELDDIYAAAWVGTLRALAGREADLADDEIRSYVLTAVANQAGKELRRRRRKPTAPLELVGAVADPADTPEERVAAAEESLVTRDLLASLPPRRRAVIVLRYGWGLEPSQVCRLVAGLSPRAYRKEVTRGVDELAEKMRAVETGAWCADRESVLKRFVTGLANDDELRQARAHLSHCRHCTDFVARLSGHLHDLGSTATALASIDGVDGHIAFGDRVADLADRATGLVAPGSAAGSTDASAQVVASGGIRGAGAAGAGVLTKLASVGAAGKLALACVGGGVAATACVAAGVAPFGLGGNDEPRPQPARAARPAAKQPAPPKPVIVETLPSQVGNGFVPPPAQSGGGETITEPKPSAPAEAAPSPESAAPTVSPSAAPEVQEFDVAAAAAPPPTASTPLSSAGGASSETQAANQEFGP